MVGASDLGVTEPPRNAGARPVWVGAWGRGATEPPSRWRHAGAWAAGPGARRRGRGRAGGPEALLPHALRGDLARAAERGRGARGALPGRSQAPACSPRGGALHGLWLPGVRVGRLLRGGAGGGRGVAAGGAARGARGSAAGRAAR
ncbi:unnamed protein product, partial [Prorocentrum cordatum]